MENATKALIIAGGILLAIITISILLYSFNNISLFQDSKRDMEELQQINRYNQEYESYNKKVMFGTDVVSVLNKSMSNNNKKNAKYGSEYFVNIIVIVKDLKYGTESIKNKTYSIETTEKINKIKEEILKNDSNPESLFSRFKEATFKCKSVKYNDYGRICEMKFEQIPVKENIYY